MICPGHKVSKNQNRTRSKVNLNQTPPAAALTPDNPLETPDLQQPRPQPAPPLPQAAACAKGKPTVCRLVPRKLLQPHLDHKTKPLPVHSRPAIPFPTVTMLGSHDPLQVSPISPLPLFCQMRDSTSNSLFTSTLSRGRMALILV